jgi:hypothetical protein
MAMRANTPKDVLWGTYKKANDKMTTKGKFKNRSNTIYLTGYYDEKYCFQVIDFLPLLFDKIIFDESSYGLAYSVEKYYSIERIKSLCENQILIFHGDPTIIHYSAGPPELLPEMIEMDRRLSKKEIAKPEFWLARWIYDKGYFIPDALLEDKTPKQWESLSLQEKHDFVQKTLAFANFALSLKEDLKDEELSKLIIRLLDSDASDASVSLSKMGINMGLIYSFSLDSSLLIPPQLKPILVHKFQRIIKQSKAIIPSPEYSEEIQALAYFLKSSPLKIPQQLSIDDLIEFRKDKKAIEFRLWLNNVVQEAKTKGIDNAIDIGQELRMEFQELCTSYKDRSNLVAGVISGIATTIAGIIAGPLGGLAAVPSYLTSLKGVKLLWEIYGTNNWAFFFIKKSKRE